MPERPLAPSAPELTIAGRKVVKVLRWSRRHPVRAAVFLLMLAVTLVVLLIRARELLLLWEFVIAFDVLFLFWPVVQGTYLLYTRRSLPIRAEYKMSDAAFFEGLHQFQVAPMNYLKFSFAACLTRIGTNVTTDIALFHRPDNGDLAEVVRVKSSLRTRNALVFNTKFDDGLILETSNVKGRRISAALPNFPVFRFPQIRIPSDLYLLHTTIKQELSTTRKPLILPPSERVRVFMEDADIIYRLHMTRGDYKTSSSGDRWVHTLRGAFRLAFIRAWPVRFIRNMLAERDAIRKAKSLGFTIDPKFGRLKRKS